MYHMWNRSPWTWTNASPTRNGSFSDEVSIGPSPILLKVRPSSTLMAKPTEVSTETDVRRLHPQVYP